MKNKHRFEPKQEFKVGGIAWTVIQTGEDWVKCISSECVEERAFDEENNNDFAASTLRAYLNGDFLRHLIKAGAPEEMFEYFNIDLKNYGGDRVRIGLITCEEYRLLRGNIPALPDRWWWTATPHARYVRCVRCVLSDGSLHYYDACGGGSGVRPLCVFNSEILLSHLKDSGAFGIYAGTLNKAKTMWQNKTECTDEAINAVRDYMVGELLGGLQCAKAKRSGYEWTLKDGRIVKLMVEITEAEKELSED